MVFTASFYNLGIFLFIYFFFLLSEIFKFVQVLHQLKERKNVPHGECCLLSTFGIFVHLTILTFSGQNIGCKTC